MNQIIGEVLSVLSDELRANGIIVETRLEGRLPKLEVDHVQIQQTLINLVHNAIEAMAGVTDRAKTLVLASSRQGEELVIQVRDAGFGVKDPTLIFEPFVTSKESAWDGLSIARTIVEAHGGRVWATPNEDAGMTFAFTVPLAVGARRESRRRTGFTATSGSIGRAFARPSRQPREQCPSNGFSK